MSDRAVSAIIIFLNEERFLAEAVESVFAQSFRDWELLLIDDGSTDGSAELAGSLARKHSDRVRYLRHADQRNHGMSASRNLGLNRARGQLVGFLDADDIWLPNKLSEQVAVFEREPEAALVYGRTLIWNSWQHSQTHQDFFYELGVPPNRRYGPPRLFELLIENKVQTPTTCNALMRRTLIDEIGGFEEAFRGMFEDQVFFAKALLRTNVYVDGRPWAKYRQHDESCSAQSAKRRGGEGARLRFLNWVDRHLQAELARYPVARDLLRREIRRARFQLAKRTVKRALVEWRIG